MSEIKGEGDCFMAAVKFMEAAGPGCRLLLCHARICPTTGPLEDIEHCHAWIEDDHMVVDPSNGEAVMVHWPIYYTLAGLRPSSEVKRYTWAEMVEWLHKAGHFGPWEIERTDYEMEVLGDE